MPKLISDSDMIYLRATPIPRALESVQQAFYGFASLGAPAMIGMESGGIAYWAHAGGFAIGALVGPLFGLFSQPDRIEVGAETPSAE